MITEGEWENDGLEISVRGRGVIANCPTTKKGGVMECIANARLIAAAPDLYEACKGMLEGIGLTGYYPAAGKTKTDAIRQAVAKAEGKE